MMMMKQNLKVQIVSKETIKPSSPTPPHLKTYTLSFIDQHISQLIYIPLILFYSPNTQPQRLIDQLKTSLSEILTLYYPLAGRIKNNTIISCEDQGVGVITTQVIGSPLSQVINEAEPEDLAQLLPFHDFHKSNEEPPLLIVQFNLFECGGMAIGLCLKHKVADSSSLCTFLHNWASIARDSSLSSTDIMRPRFECATLFPPAQVPSPMHFAKGKVVSRRYILDASMIVALKAEAAATTGNSFNPSRVLAVIAFLWRTLIAMDKEKQLGFPKPSNMGIAMSLRAKMDLPFPELSFGNLVVIAMTSTTHEEEVVERIGDLMVKFDRDYVRKLRSKEEYLKLMESQGEVQEKVCKGKAEMYGVTSWCRFPLYEVDFGWGKPVWANVAAFEYKDFFVLMDTKCGEGIEVWANLDEEDMARFQRQIDRKLLARLHHYKGLPTKLGESMHT